jgi:trans-2,3-dihydro-3-hydroxyanthranilate isomerase
MMQALARELNLSESVFVLSRSPGEAEIRIFTPSTELPFAGHPVLGTAFVLAEDDPSDTIVLHTGAGRVPVVLERRAGQPVHGEMDQPLPKVAQYERTPELLRALGGVEATLPVEVYDNGPRHVLVMLADSAQVASLRVDPGALTPLGELGVSCFAAAGSEVHTRMFAPGMGVYEDPATGSAAGPLAVHLLRHGRTRSGEVIRIRQGQEIGRPSLLLARAEGTPERLARVVVGGAAVIVAAGEFSLPSA